MSDELIHLISLWAMKRGILNNSTPLAQFAKLVSEMGELGDNIAKQREGSRDVKGKFIFKNHIGRFH